VFAAGLAPTPELGDTVRSQVGALKDALTPWNAGYVYYNFVETPAEADVVLPPASYQRPREIKAVCDPDQTITSAQPVARRRLYEHDRGRGRRGDTRVGRASDRGRRARR
jgi:hypothetical protein